MNNIRNMKGITLISLIVMIILLLIVAGIAIGTLMSNNGILTGIENAKIQYGTKRFEEEIELVVEEEIINKRINQIEASLKDLVEENLNKNSKGLDILTIKDNEENPELEENELEITFGEGYIYIIAIEENGQVIFDYLGRNDGEPFPEIEITQVETLKIKVTATVLQTSKTNKIAKVEIAGGETKEYVDGGVEFTLPASGTYKVKATTDNGKSMIAKITVVEYGKAFIELKPTTATRKATATISWGETSLTNKDKYQYYINGEWQTSTTAKKEIEVTTNGEIVARYYDGINSYESEIYNVTNIDRVEPNTFTAIATGGQGIITAGGTTEDVAADDNGVEAGEGIAGVASYEYSIDGNTWQASNEFTELASGEYTVYVKAIDKAGNERISIGKQVTVTNRYTLTVNPGEMTYIQELGTTKEITAPIQSYIVSYDSNGGSSCTASTYTKVFSNWEKSGAGSISDATANPTTYTYGRGNGTITANYSNGTAIILPTPTRTGYSFDGWYSDLEFTNKIGEGGSSYTPTPTNDITLYAKWVDDIAPTKLTIQSKLDNSSGNLYTPDTWTNKNVYVELTSAEEGSGVKQYEWYENGAWTTRDLTTSNSVGTITYTAERNTTLRFRVIDNNGNISEEAQMQIKIDKTAPTIDSFTAANACTTSTFTGKATDSGSGIVGWQINTSAGTYTAITATTSQITKTNSTTSTAGKYFYVKDAAGNVATSSQVTGTVLGHDMVEGICTYKKCSRCSYETGTSTHSWSDYTVTTKGTCTAAGSKQRTCLNNCGGTETATIASRGHAMSAYKKYSATQHRKTCTRTATTEYAACSYAATPANHSSYSYTNCTTTKTVTCSGCGATKSVGTSHVMDAASSSCKNCKKGAAIWTSTSSYSY